MIMLEKSSDSNGGLSCRRRGGPAVEAETYYAQLHIAAPEAGQSILMEYN
jgi:hypothetical protein